ncbi:unnamed protein product [Allacma fusca]|uniref:C2H2-type domain-containing protein n=1 Tax=Allacma fusca TaxID=39272 RepID=A0A8J2PA08_9HEXA|nr:unnamed protein product [Allacma fusca]
MDKMGDPHTRSMDAGWNPSEVWPVPVECLLNGMSADAHLMFGGGPVFSPHFRHRFQPPVHLSSTHLAPLPGSINVNLSIPLTQHSLVETGQVDESGDPSVPVQDSSGQDGHNLSQPLSMDSGDVLEESDEASEDDEEDEVDDGMPVPMGHSHEQQHPHGGPITMSHGMETDSLVQCQQQVVRNGLQQTALLQIDGSQIQQCIQQQKEDDAVRHNHHGHNQPIDSMIMSMEDDFTNQNSSDGDPNSGFSVHGKMYFEGRVVLHLKQWTDTPASDGNSVGLGSLGNFSSCAEQQHSKGFHGCAVCRLKSPHENHRNQKEAHRHTVKGVLFTFEDCIIVELYPEPPPSSNNNTTADPKPPPTESQQPPSHPMPIESYMNSAVTIPSQPQQQQEQVKKFIHHLDVNCIGNPVPQNPATKHTVTISHPQATDDHSWWDEFESSDDLKRADVEDEHESSSDPVDPSCISNVKLRNQATAGDEDAGDFKIKPKSPCPATYLAPAQLDSQSCRNPSVVPLDDVDLNSGPHSVHVNTSSDNDIAILQSSEESQQSVVTPTSAQPDEQISTTTDATVSKHTNLQFSCTLCKTSFHVKRLLRKHLEENHSDDNPLRCLLCNTQFTEEKRLKKHACARKNSRKTSSKSAIITSNPELVFCNGDEDSNGKGSSEEEDGSEQSKLGIETTDVRSNRDLKHLPEDSSSSGEINDIDQENSGDEDDCKSSQRTTEKSTKKADKPYKCDTCGKRFTVERRLRNHKMSHNSERSSQCEKCGKRFARKDKLMRHMYVHSEEKMFSCDICQKRFSRRDKLGDHLKSHGGADEIHNCPMCQKQFLRPDILKQHVKLHTMGNKHQCSECLRFVTGKDRLEKHMARHKEAKVLGQTLLCPLCTKYFIQKQSLKAHIKKFHPNSNINIDSQDSEMDQQQRLGQPSINSQVDSESLQTVKRNRRVEQVSKCKQFECNHCHRVFTKKQAFKKHLRKHQASPLTSPNDSLVNSPSPEQEEPLLTLSSADSTVHILPNPMTNSSPTTTHVILSGPHPSTPSKITNSSNPTSLNVSTSGHAIIQENLNSAQCSHLQHLPLGTHPPLSHHAHNQLLAHGGHPTHGDPVTSMTHPTTGQIHTNLSQHVSVPTIQHHVSMATQQTMCGSSYVLAYPHYSYH